MFVIKFCKSSVDRINNIAASFFSNKTPKTIEPLSSPCSTAQQQQANFTNYKAASRDKPSMSLLDASLNDVIVENISSSSGGGNNLGGERAELSKNNSAVGESTNSAIDAQALNETLSEQGQNFGNSSNLADNEPADMGNQNSSTNLMDFSALKTPPQAKGQSENSDKSLINIGISPQGQSIDSSMLIADLNSESFNTSPNSAEIVRTGPEPVNFDSERAQINLALDQTLDEDSISGPPGPEISKPVTNLPEDDFLNSLNAALNSLHLSDAGGEKLSPHDHNNVQAPESAKDTVELIDERLKNSTSGSPDDGPETECQKTANPMTNRTRKRSFETNRFKREERKLSIDSSNLADNYKRDMREECVETKAELSSSIGSRYIYTQDCEHSDVLRVSETDFEASDAFTRSSAGAAVSRNVVSSTDDETLRSSTPFDQSFSAAADVAVFDVNGVDDLWADVRRQRLRIDDDDVDDAITDDITLEAAATTTRDADDSRTSNESFLTATSAMSLSSTAVDDSANDTATRIVNDASTFDRALTGRHSSSGSTSSVSRNKTFTRKSHGDRRAVASAEKLVADAERRDANANGDVLESASTTPRVKILPPTPSRGATAAGDVAAAADDDAKNSNDATLTASPRPKGGGGGRSGKTSESSSPRKQTGSATKMPPAVQQTAVVAPMVNKNLESTPVNKNCASSSPRTTTNEPFVVDSDALDYLQMASSSTNSVSDSDLYRQSLYVKFDPLVSQNDQLNQVLRAQDRRNVESTGLAANQRTAESVVDRPTGSQPQTANLVELKTPSPRQGRLVESQDQAPVTPVCPPTVVLKKKPTPQPVVRLTDSVDAPAFSSASPTPSPQNQSCCFFDDSLFPFECDVAELMNESDRGDSRVKKIKMQCQAYILGKEKEWLAKFKEERDRSDKLAAISAKEISDNRLAIKEYKKTIEELLAKIDDFTKEQQRFANYEHVVREKERATEDLRTVENALSELHRRYENLRSNVEEYKQNEEKWREVIVETQNKLNTTEEMFHTLKDHAEEKLNAANIEINRLRKANESDTLALKALCKKQESQLESMARALEQKQRECDELSHICDELIKKLDRKKP